MRYPHNLTAVFMLTTGEAVQENNETLFLTAPGKEAVNPLMLTNAAYYSVWTGETVTLPLSPEEYEKALEVQMEKEREK